MQTMNQSLGPLTPIVLFVYNRPWHTQQTIEALRKNVLANESELYIFSDAAQEETARQDVKAVREYLKTINGFKHVTIFEQKTNLGLAGSIINGVTKIISEYGQVIVLEDDIVTSPYFLKFMNEALEFYKHKKRIWHISGWNYPIVSDEKDDVFLWRVMNCWGWATWADRWSHYEKNTQKLMQTFTQSDIRRFNLDGRANFWAQVIANEEGAIDTWAIYWYATIFKHGGLCLNPVQTFVENIGIDGSGENCSSNKSYIDQVNMKPNVTFVDDDKESEKYLNAVKKYLKIGIIDRIRRRLQWTSK